MQPWHITNNMAYNAHRPLPKVRRWFPILIFLTLSFSLFQLFSVTKHVNLLLSTPTSTYPPTINLVLATTIGHDYSWTRSLTPRNLTLIPYIANSPTSTYHPIQNKGHEALMYLTYLTSFYDRLPDISIFIHDEDYTWHIDSALSYSTLQAINRLDLDEVKKQNYVNLRTSWEGACPSWINTSITFSSPRYDPKKTEEPYIAEAWQSNFPGHELPETLAQPCCSQFAVTKEAILRNPKEDYERQIRWILDTQLPDSISGRIFEHFWQYTFLGKDVWCPDEWISLCRNFAVCFEHREEFQEWNELEGKRQKLFEYSMELHATGVDESDMELITVNAEIQRLRGISIPCKERAIENGRNEEVRRRILSEGMSEG